MTPEEWILVNYKYTGDKIDFVELKKLYADYCKDGNNIKYNIIIAEYFLVVLFIISILMN